MILNEFLDSLEEASENDIINTINTLAAVAIFDDDGEFTGWTKSEINKIGSQKFNELKKQFVAYAKKLGFNSEASSMYLLFATYESGIENEPELKELAKDLEEYK